MVNFTSWKFWVIVALALGTLACAGRRERREQAREDRRERAEQRRAERQQRYEDQRAQRAAQPQQRAAEPAEQPVERPAPPPRAVVAATPPPPPPSAPAVAADGSSKVVFLRPSKQSSNVEPALFDVTEPGEPRFIGSVTPASKFSYSLKPGLYTFMVVGETAEFMQATVVGGKTYYALVIPKSGAKRFGIEPVRQHEIGGKDFVSWDRGTRSVDGAVKTYEAGDASEKRLRYWAQDWMKKSEAQRAELTLNAEDGR